MEFGLSEEQNLLKRSVDGFLDSESSLEKVRSFADNGGDVWAGLSELGVPAVLIPESAGGLGLEHARRGHRRGSARRPYRPRAIRQQCGHAAGGAERGRRRSRNAAGATGSWRSYCRCSHCRRLRRERGFRHYE